MNNNHRKINFCAQGQRWTARVLLIVGLLVGYSPQSARAFSLSRVMTTWAAVGASLFGSKVSPFKLPDQLDVLPGDSRFFQNSDLRTLLATDILAPPPPGIDSAPAAGSATSNCTSYNTTVPPSDPPSITWENLNDETEADTWEQILCERGAVRFWHIIGAGNWDSTRPTFDFGMQDLDECTEKLAWLHQEIAEVIITYYIVKQPNDPAVIYQLKIRKGCFKELNLTHKGADPTLRTHQLDVTDSMLENVPEEFKNFDVTILNLYGNRLTSVPNIFWDQKAAKLTTLGASVSTLGLDHNEFTKMPESVKELITHSGVSRLSISLAYNLYCCSQQYEQDKSDFDIGRTIVDCQEPTSLCDAINTTPTSSS